MQSSKTHAITHVHGPEQAVQDAVSRVCKENVLGVPLQLGMSAFSFSMTSGNGC